MTRSGWRYNHRLDYHGCVHVHLAQIINPVTVISSCAVLVSDRKNIWCGCLANMGTHKPHWWLKFFSGVSSYLFGFCSSRWKHSGSLWDECHRCWGCLWVRICGVPLLAHHCNSRRRDGIWGCLESSTYSLEHLCSSRTPAPASVSIQSQQNLTFFQ